MDKRKIPPTHRPRKGPPQPSEFDPEKVAEIERKKEATLKSIWAMGHLKRMAAGEPLWQPVRDDGEKAA